MQAEVCSEPFEVSESLELAELSSIVQHVVELGDMHHVA